jgi:hypothetical protein
MPARQSSMKKPLTARMLPLRFRGKPSRSVTVLQTGLPEQLHPAFGGSMMWGNFNLEVQRRLCSIFVKPFSADRPFSNT